MRLEIPFRGASMTVQKGQPQNYVGQRVSRVDGPDKVRGAATYTAEFDLPQLAHAVLVSATIPHGSIKKIDQKAARAVPGVLDILTHESEGMKLGPVKAYPRGPAGTSVLPLQSPKIEPGAAGGPGGGRVAGGRPARRATAGDRVRRPRLPRHAGAGNERAAAAGQAADAAAGPFARERQKGA